MNKYLLQFRNRDTKVWESYWSAPASSRRLAIRQFKDLEFKDDKDHDHISLNSMYPGRQLRVVKA